MPPALNCNLVLLYCTLTVLGLRLLFVAKGRTLLPKKKSFFPPSFFLRQRLFLILFSSFSDIYARPPLSCCILFFFLSLSLLFSEGPWGNILSGGKGKGRETIPCVWQAKGVHCTHYRSDIPPGALPPRPFGQSHHCRKQQTRLHYSINACFAALERSLSLILNDTALGRHGEM